MKKNLLLSISIFLLVFATPAVLESLCKFEGAVGSPVENFENSNAFAFMFIPYNPVIVEIGAATGAGTIAFASTYPYGKIYAFEPHPELFLELTKRVSVYKNVQPINLAVNAYSGFSDLYVKGDDKLSASLLNNVRNTNSTQSIRVECITLDEWCQKNKVPVVHLLRLDAGGLEYQILQHSPVQTSKVHAIVIKTHLAPIMKTVVRFRNVKAFLEYSGFTMLAHWYHENGTGEAVFVRKCMYDSIFN